MGRKKIPGGEPIKSETRYAASGDLSQGSCESHGVTLGVSESETPTRRVSESLSRRSARRGADGDSESQAPEGGHPQQMGMHRSEILRSPAMDVQRAHVPAITTGA